MVVFAPREKDLDIVETAIEQEVELDKMGRPTKLLGMELTWNNDNKSVKLTQTSATERLAKEHNVANHEIPIKSLPLNPLIYEKGSEKETMSPTMTTKYQSLIGGLLYISRHTRPEISLHVNLLGRRTSHPSQQNWKAALGVLQYLVHNEGGIQLAKQRQEVIRVYTDASYGGENSISQTGTFMTLANQPILWSSRRQETTA